MDESKAEVPAVDLRGSEERCGEPALERVRRAFAALGVGDQMEVIADVADHLFVLRAWVTRHGGTVVGETKDGAATRILIRRSAATIL